MPSFPLFPLNPPPHRSPKPGGGLAEAGQTVLLLALMFTVLLIFVGLATDTGIIYVSYGQFRRAVDAAALAAASQYRQARSAAQIDQDALQFIKLQGFNPTSYSVEDCGTVSPVGTYPPAGPYNTTTNINPDPAVCTYPVRKLVRVRANTDIHLVFVPMFNVFPEVLSIQAQAVAEAASLEIMLVIDVSPSMTYDGTNPFDSADYCNVTNWDDAAVTFSLPAPYIVNTVQYSPIHSCRPFESVRDAAVQFVDQFVKFPFDRVGIVTFCNSARLNQSIGIPNVSDNKVTTLTALKDLDVCTGTSNPPSSDSATCDIYDTTGFLGACMATDTGDGLLLARQDLVSYSRPNAVRFVILLSDGAVNGSGPTSATYYSPDQYACPKNIVSTDTNYDPYAFAYLREFCQDGDSRWQAYHAAGDVYYDADDYARDQMPGFANMGNMIVFTIGLGNAVTYNPVDADGCPTDAGVWGTANPNNSWEISYGNAGNPLCNADGLPAGEQLLRYIADAGDGDGIDYADPNNPRPCGRDNSDGDYYTTIGTSCGNYYFAASGSQLQNLFKQIAQHIYTRITK